MKNKNSDLFTLDKFIEESLYNKKITAPNIFILFSEMIAIRVISFGEKPQPRKKILINLPNLGQDLQS